MKQQKFTFSQLWNSELLSLEAARLVSSEVFLLVLWMLEKSLKKRLATVGDTGSKLFIAAGRRVCLSLRDPHSGRAGSLMVSEKVSGQARVKQP